MNERNKVGVRDGGIAKRKRSTEIYMKCCYTRNEGSTIQVQLESLYTESSDTEGLQIFAHGAILCPNWTHLYKVSLWEIHAKVHIIVFYSKTRR